MTVRELISKLEKLPPERPVGWMHEDSELPWYFCEADEAAYKVISDYVRLEEVERRVVLLTQ